MMPKKIWIRCVVISLAVSLISPLFNVAMWQPRMGIDSSVLAEMSPEELAVMGDKMQRRKNQGSGPIRPFFMSSLGMRIYLMTAGFFFVPLLLATLLVGYLGNRDKTETKRPNIPLEGDG